MDVTGEIQDHYGRDGLRGRLLAALESAGLRHKPLSPTDLAPLDQFHARGLAATIELADETKIEQGAMVVDIGSGLGGPSRYLAARFGCRVHGVDLSPAFVAAARFLAERSGLGGRVTYECADALALPSVDKRYDLAWTQHVAMNIADRDRLYAEAHRVLKPGGRFAIYDAVAGPAGPLHFPVPWARGPDTSFLLSPEATLKALEKQGFRVIDWSDRTSAGVLWFEEQQKARALPPTGASPLGLGVVMGPEFPAMAANFARNLREGRAGLIQAVLGRP